MSECLATSSSIVPSSNITTYDHPHSQRLFKPVLAGVIVLIVTSCVIIPGIFVFICCRHWCGPRHHLSADLFIDGPQDSMAEGSNYQPHSGYTHIGKQGQSRNPVSELPGMVENDLDGYGRQAYNIKRKVSSNDNSGTNKWAKLDGDLQNYKVGEEEILKQLIHQRSSNIRTPAELDADLGLYDVESRTSLSSHRVLSEFPRSDLANIRSNRSMNTGAQLGTPGLRNHRYQDHATYQLNIPLKQEPPNSQIVSRSAFQSPEPIVPGGHMMPRDVSSLSIMPKLELQESSSQHSTWNDSTVHAVVHGPDFHRYGLVSPPLCQNYLSLEQGAYHDPALPVNSQGNQQVASVNSAISLPRTGFTSPLMPVQPSTQYELPHQHSVMRVPPLDTSLPPLGSQESHPVWSPYSSDVSASYASNSTMTSVSMPNTPSGANPHSYSP